MLFCIVSILFLSGHVDGVRMGRELHNRTNAGLSPERVHQLVTFGAARPGTDQLRNNAKSGFCFDGYRFVNQDSLKVDVVPTLGQETWAWSHPLMESIKVNSNSEYWSYKCGTNGLAPRVPSVLLHLSSEYLKRLSTVSLANEVTMNGLAISYKDSASTIEPLLSSGWTLLGTTTHDEDKCNLVKKGGQCILTFSGTDDWDDWYTNLGLWPISFCNLGINKIHSGFAGELMSVVTSSGYKSRIKPHLSSCSHLTVTGHSMGGAIAAIFAACANNANAAVGNSDFEQIRWW